MKVVNPSPMVTPVLTDFWSVVIIQCNLSLKSTLNITGETYHPLFWPDSHQNGDDDQADDSVSDGHNRSQAGIAEGAGHTSHSCAWWPGWHHLPAQTTGQSFLHITHTHTKTRAHTTHIYTPTHIYMYSPCPQHIICIDTYSIYKTHTPIFS